MFVLCDRMGKDWGTGTYSCPNESPDRGEEDRSQMIGQNPKTEVAPSFRQRK